MATSAPDQGVIRGDSGYPTDKQRAGLDKMRDRATAGRSKVGPRSKVRTLSGQILPHFDINNFSVAQKLTKLDSLVLVQIKLALIIALISHKVCEDIQTSSLATILSWSKLLDRRRGRSKKIILSSPAYPSH